MASRSSARGVSCFRLVLIGLGVAGLSGCAPGTDAPPPISGTTLDAPSDAGTVSRAYPGGSPERALTSAAGLPIGRGRSMIVLENNTVLAGDNILVTEPARPAFAMAPLSARLRDLPTSLAAFGALSTRNMRTTSDSAGPIRFAAARPTDGVTCVFAMRDVARPFSPALPGAGATSLTLRNCVVGTEAEALTPILSPSAY